MWFDGDLNLELEEAGKYGYKKGYEDAQPKWRKGTDTEGLDFFKAVLVTYRWQDGTAWLHGIGWIDYCGVWRCDAFDFSDNARYNAENIFWMPLPEPPEEEEK